jgi:arginyl-tRNA synthetase
MEIAQAIVDNADLEGTYFREIKIAGPGFINFYLSDVYYADILFEIKEAGDSYGRSNYGEGKRINVEFVSANPTGPMHMGNARGGALGDCLAGVLDYAGYEVAREFYPRVR